MKFLKYIIIISSIALGNSPVNANSDYFDEMVTELLQKQIADKKIIIEPSYSSAGKVLQLKRDQDKIKSAVIDKFDPQYSNFSIKIEFNNGKLDSISGKYTSYILLPVAARYIKFGEVIQPCDLSTVKVRLESVKKGFFTDEGEVIGMQAKQYIQPGSMFRTYDLVRPTVIKTNDPVNITFSSGTISLKTVGIALGNGAVGDMIKVRNESSGAVLLGQIVNKNTVQIGGE